MVRYEVIQTSDQARLLSDTYVALLIFGKHIFTAYGTVLKLARERGIEVVEARISVAESDWSEVEEVLTCGTAVGVQGVRELSHAGRALFEGNVMGPVTAELASALNAVRFGTTQDHPEWRVAIDR